MASTDKSTSEEKRPGLGNLVSTLSEKLSALIRAEIELVKAEISEKVRSAAIGLGLFAAAGAMAFFAVAVLVAAMVLGLAEALPAWLAALIVAVVLLGLTALLVALGKRALERSSKPLPTRAQASIKADLAAVKEGLSAGADS